MHQLMQCYNTLHHDPVVWADAMADMRRPIAERIFTEHVVMHVYMKRLSAPLRSGFFSWVANTVRTNSYVWPATGTKWDNMRTQVSLLPATHM